MKEIWYNVDRFGKTNRIYVTTQNVLSKSLSIYTNMCLRPLSYCSDHDQAIARRQTTLHNSHPDNSQPREFPLTQLPITNSFGQKYESSLDQGGILRAGKCPGWKSSEEKLCEWETSTGNCPMGNWQVVRELLGIVGNRSDNVVAIMVSVNNDP